MYNNQFIPKQEIVKVTGREGAMAYQMGAYSSALLLDNDPSKNIIWLVCTDGSGYKTVTQIDYKIREEIKPETQIQNLESKIDRLERMLNEHFGLDAEQQ